MATLHRFYCIQQKKNIALAAIKTKREGLLYPDTRPLDVLTGVMCHDDEEGFQNISLIEMSRPWLLG